MNGDRSRDMRVRWAKKVVISSPQNVVASEKLELFGVQIWEAFKDEIVGRRTLMSGLMMTPNVTSMQEKRQSEAGYNQWCSSSFFIYVSSV